MDELATESRAALELLLESTGHPHDSLFVLGGSTSAVGGARIGKAWSLEAAFSILDGLLPLLAEHRLDMAVQGCEHVNRSLVVPAAVAERYALTEVSVVPIPKAGGSLATAYYTLLDEPVVVADLKSRARLGLDVGGVLVGMHLQPVAVPVWFGELQIGSARLSGGYSRQPRVGGERAVYDRREIEKYL